MTNEEKAKEITCVLSYQDSIVAQKMLIQMAEWKDEQQKELIKNACQRYKWDLESFCNVLHRIRQTYGIPQLGDLIDMKESVNQFRISLNNAD